MQHRKLAKLMAGAALATTSFQAAAAVHHSTMMLSKESAGAYAALMCVIVFAILWTGSFFLSRLGAATAADMARFMAGIYMAYSVVSTITLSMNQVPRAHVAVWMLAGGAALLFIATIQDVMAGEEEE